ncbi:MAG: outer membrane beta-barrel protein [Flavobacteriaceae bacterium]|nr:outer membrane beta-barrel protein [Flavobacteriaceae bacterium]
MNKLFIAFAMLFVIYNIDAQTDNFNAFSLETGFGVAIPISPKESINESKISGLNQFNIGGRYMFTKSFGIKASYQFNGFRTNEVSTEISNGFLNEFSNEGIDYHALRLEAVYNLGRLFNLPYSFYENFGLLTHIGVGYSRGKPIGQNFSEQTANLQWGITPLFKLNKTIALFGDLTYVSNIKQHYAYDGSLLNPSFDHVTGGYITVGIGVMFYIGEEGRHADWY